MPGNSLYLAIDQGGHSTRAFIFNHTGRVIAQSKYNIHVNRPRDDWVEQDPAELMTSINTVVESVSEQLGADCKNVVAAGIATQRSNIACWNRTTGQPLSAIISWQDRRAHLWLEKYQTHNAQIHKKTGLLLTAHYGVSKLRWCLDHLQAVKQAFANNTLAWGPMAGFLNFSITEEKRHMVDPANASRTLLYSLVNHDWDDELLGLFGIPKQPLPQCVATRFDYGTLKLGYKKLEQNKMGQYNLGQCKVPLTIMSGDQSAALYAFGMPKSDTVYINMGTGAFLQKPTLDRVVYSPRLLSSIVLHDAQHSHHVLECTVNGAGSALTQVGQQLGVDSQVAEQKLGQWLSAAKNPPLFLNGVSGLGAPYWIPDFHSRFIGDGQDWEKIAAVGESILFLIKVNLDMLSKASGEPVKQLLLTGGLASCDEMCQRLADLADIAIYRPDECEATALGTAYLLAQCPSVWPEGLKGVWFYPKTNPAFSNRFERWHKEMQTELKKYQSLLDE